MTPKRNILDDVDPKLYAEVVRRLHDSALYKITIARGLNLPQPLVARSTLRKGFGNTPEAKALDGSLVADSKSRNRKPERVPSAQPD